MDRGAADFIDAEVTISKYFVLATAPFTDQDVNDVAGRFLSK